MSIASCSISPADIAALVAELAALGSTIRVGLDVVGGIAGLTEAMLAEAGFTFVHVPGLAVNRARQGTVGGAWAQRGKHRIPWYALMRERRPVGAGPAHPCATGLGPRVNRVGPAPCGGS